MPSFWDAFNEPERPERPALPANVTPIDASRAGRYASRALADECERVASAPEGTRNDTLNRAAFNLAQFIPEGHLTERDVVDNLTAAAHVVGLEAREIDLTITSGLRAGSQHPRDIPEQREPVATLPSLAPAAPPASAASAEDQGQGQGDSEPRRTSWWPQPITEVAASSTSAPEPTHLARTDGHRLFYAGKVNGLLGESESGKTWVALLAVAQAAQVGERILYLDFEDSAKGIEDRMGLFGLTTEQLALIDYANPDESFGLAQSADLHEALAASRYDLVVLDGVNAAMAVMGLKLEDNNDATVFAQRLLRPLADTGACVVTIDHVPKNAEARGKGGIGAQAKRAMMTGTCLRVEVSREFGVGMAGELKLTVDKDRTGKVRGVSAGAKNAGVAHIDSTDPERVVMRIQAPDLRPTDQRGPWRPTGLMEKVSRLLEDVEGLSGAAIEREVGGKRDHVRSAVRVLVDEGFVERVSGGGSTILHRSLRAFREDDLPALSSDLAPSPRPRPDLAPGRGQHPPTDLAPSPRPLGGARGEVGGEGSGRPSKGGTSPLILNGVDRVTGEVHGDPDDEQWWQR